MNYIVWVLFFVACYYFGFFQTLGVITFFVGGYALIKELKENYQLNKLAKGK